MKRAGFVTTLVGTLLCSPLAAGAEQARVHRVGFLAPQSFFYPWAYAAHLWLGELGYVKGTNVAFEHAYARGTKAQLSRAAADLVRRPVDAVVTSGTAAVRAAKQATRTVPIVMVTDDDPVRTGLVESLARPGGNVTGLVARVPELCGKRLAMLTEVVPGLSRVFVLWNPADPDGEDERSEIRTAARTLDLTLEWRDVRSREELESAFHAPGGPRPGALLVMASGLTRHEAALITDLAAESRLPAIYPSRYFVDLPGSAGLMSYGASPIDLSRRLAVYVDKVLKGANPALLPLERPTRYELVINLKTADLLGLSIPPSVLLRADQVIE